MNKTTKTIALVGILTALYVVFALTLKIPMGVGNIALDLGYIVLTVSAFKLGMKSAIVGGLGALIESVLFSAYGISYGWIVMNIIIGLICGYVFTRYTPNKREYLFYSLIIVAVVLIGVSAKTVIECQLYSIPYLVKIPKSLVAWIIDSIVMIIGIFVSKRVVKEIKV